MEVLLQNALKYLLCVNDAEINVWRVLHVDRNKEKGWAEVEFELPRGWRDYEADYTEESKEYKRVRITIQVSV